MVQNEFQIAGHKPFLCDVNMENVKSGFIYGGIVITLDSYEEQNDVITLNNPNSEVLQKFYAEHSFGSSNEKLFNVILVEVEKGILVCSRDTIISYHHSDKSKDIWRASIRDVF